MAILKQTVHVKSQGATGWNHSDVLDALETTFSNLGLHGGPELSGVPHIVLTPGGGRSSNTDAAYKNSTVNSFSQAGGGRIKWYNNSTQYGSGESVIKRFYVSNIGNTAYRLLEEFRFDQYDVDTASDTISHVRHGLSDGDLITYAVGQSNDPNKNIGLTVGNDYYVINATTDTFQVSDTSGGSAKDLTQANQTGFYFRRKDMALYDNYTIRVKSQDTIYFYKNNISGGTGTFYLLKNSDAYDATKLLEDEGFSYQTTPTYNGDDSYTTVWETRGYPQTEDEALFPDRGPGEGTGTNLDDYGITKYTYANSDNTNNSSMRGQIIVEPWSRYETVFPSYWKYTVPASGSRSELKLRVYRRGNSSSTYRGYISNITIHNIATGWTTNDTFTIPGQNVGGVAGTNDIEFGVVTPETGSSGNGICGLTVSDFGGTSKFFQKNDSGNFAILKVVHDATKSFGTTYYSFGMDPTNNNQFTIQSGSTWRFINHAGHTLSTTSTSDSTVNKFMGLWGGIPGLDYQANYNFIRRSESTDSYYATQYYARSTDSTTYPLEIRTYRAQSPQDTDFAIIQFVQIVSGDAYPYATFSISRGSQHGSDIYDLDYVYQDTITNFYKSTSPTRTITFRYGGTNRGGSYDANSEPVTDDTVARSASYGYFRQPDGSTYRYYVDTDFTSNIDTTNVQDSEGISIYYRNSNFDKVSSSGSVGKYHKGKKVNPSADYYKPISGLPISTALLPIPYYLPDDFVMLPVAATPGATIFRTGDTVTINSGTEVYEIILASYESNQTGLNGVPSATSMGMLFLARTT